MTEKRKQMIIEGNEKLSLYGIGPFFTWPSLLVTIISSVIFGWKVKFGRVEQLRTAFLVIGIILIVEAVLLYTNAVFKVKIMDCIRQDKLLTTGVYAYVRNPIYSAVLFLCAGIILIARNYCLLCLLILHWGYLTILLKTTEEIWLKEFYGEAYLEYCKKTNRCIPWFKRNNREKLGRKRLSGAAK